MEQLKFILAAVVLFAGVYDLFTRRIPNWWTFPAMVVGLALGFSFGGTDGLIASVLGIIAGFVLYFPVYLFGAMGAGDVKLLMVVGAWTEPLFVVYVAGTAIVLGGVYALFDVIRRGRLQPVLRTIWQFIQSRYVFRGMPMGESEIDRERSFSFGMSLALATMTIIWLEQSGRLS